MLRPSLVLAVPQLTTHSLSVLPDGPTAIKHQELGSKTEYYKAAAPVLEVQVARAGYRLAAWLDLIVAGLATTQSPSSSPSDDL